MTNPVRPRVPPGAAQQDNDATEVKPGVFVANHSTSIFQPGDPGGASVSVAPHPQRIEQVRKRWATAKSDQENPYHESFAYADIAALLAHIDAGAADRTRLGTHLQDLVQQWRQGQAQAAQWAEEHEIQDDGWNAHAFRKERRIWKTCADQLEAVLARLRPHPEDTKAEGLSLEPRAE